MAGLSFSVDKVVSKAIRRKLNNVASGIEKATSRALNRTSTSTIAFFSKETRKEVNVKASTLKKGIRKQRARPKNPVAVMNVSGAHVPLIAMGARQTKRGVTVRKYKTGGRILLKGAFIKTMPKSGHIGVFRRVNESRLPIQEQFGPSLIALWVKRDTPISLHAVTTLQKEMNRQILFLRNK